MKNEVCYCSNYFSKNIFTFISIYFFIFNFSHINCTTFNLELRNEILSESEELRMFTELKNVQKNKKISNFLYPRFSENLTKRWRFNMKNIKKKFKNYREYILEFFIIKKIIMSLIFIQEVSWVLYLFIQLKKKRP